METGFYVGSGEGKAGGFMIVDRLPGAGLRESCPGGRPGCNRNGSVARGILRFGRLGAEGPGQPKAADDREGVEYPAGHPAPDGQAHDRRDEAIGASHALHQNQTAPDAPNRQPEMIAHNR